MVFAGPLAGATMGSTDGDFVVAQWNDEGSTSSADFPIAPLHVHHADDEAWYVLEGSLGFRLGEREVEAREGSGVLVPRGTPHTYWNAGTEPARYLLVMTGRIARLIEELHAGVDDVPALFRKYDSELLI
jgi:mannose-6-phosphate isomerase-like protein (cupin superfamily)